MTVSYLKPKVDGFCRCLDSLGSEAAGRYRDGVFTGVVKLAAFAVEVDLGQL